MQFRSGKDPVLYLENPDGITQQSRRKMLDRLAELHAMQFQDVGDPEINARIAQYEMAYRMQTSVPEVMDVATEPDKRVRAVRPRRERPRHVRRQLPARPAAGRARRAVHPALSPRLGPSRQPAASILRRQAADVDRACYALITDLKQRGLLDDTLVVWGGEFGRTNYSQGKLTATDYGRDHHPRCFTIWMAGGGIKPGITYGATDDFGYNVVENPVHVHDLHATILHLLGIDHERLTYSSRAATTA